MTDSTDKKVQALFDAIEAMKHLGRDYWLCNGTLLGVIRDGRLIPWDVDVDIGVFKDGFNKQQAIAVFKKRGFSLYSEGEGSDYLIFEKYGIKVDINIFARRGEAYVSLWRVVNRSLHARALHRAVRVLGTATYPLKRFIDRAVFSMEGYSCPDKTLASFTEVEFCGRQVRVPREYESILEWTYGPSWKTPKRNYDWRADGANNATG